MASKTITVADLKFFDITLRQVSVEGGAAVTFMQKYGYEDAASNLIPQLGRRNYTETRLTADIPANILSALVTIKDYLEEKAYEQEGMEDQA